MAVKGAMLSVAFYLPVNDGLTSGQRCVCENLEITQFKSEIEKLNQSSSFVM